MACQILKRLLTPGLLLLLQTFSTIYARSSPPTYDPSLNPELSVPRGVSHLLSWPRGSNSRFINNGLAQTPQMGWNSWNFFGCGIEETVIRSIADAMVSTGLAAAGYEYLNLDDCWAELQRNSTGGLEARQATFPSGMRALGDYIHNKNLKFGIYSDAGYFTCARQPGSLTYETQDARSFAEWGVDYLKYDNCYDDISPPEVRYPVMRDALNRTGRPILFSMCEWGINNPATWAPAVANSWRTTGDITDTWQSVLSIVDTNNRWAAYAGPGGWNDPDMLEVGNGGLTTSEYRVHFSLWAIMKAPLLIGCDVRNMAADTASILLNTEVIAINQDSLGVQAQRVLRVMNTEIWAGPLSNKRIVVALVNLGTAATNITVTWDVIGLGLELGLIATARDVWEHQDVAGTLTSAIGAMVESHDLKMFILTPIGS